MDIQKLYAAQSLVRMQILGIQLWVPGMKIRGGGLQMSVFLSYFKFSCFKSNKNCRSLHHSFWLDPFSVLLFFSIFYWSDNGSLMRV